LIEVEFLKRFVDPKCHLPLRGRLSAHIVTKFLEFFDAQPRVLDNSAQCEGVNRVVVQNDQNMAIFRSGDMFPFTDDTKSRLYEQRIDVEQSYKGTST